MAAPSGKKRKIFDGRYEVIEIVGRGTDSVVYHARHAASPTQEVALKVLLNQKDRTSITERLRKEALTLVSCRHKYVVRLDDFHSIGDLCYLSMEFAREGDLRKYVSKLGRTLPADLGELFLRQTLEAIDFVHATGVIHRDIKPDNILVLNDREIRLADFGLALLPGDEPGLDEIKSGVGSFSYLPPEVLQGVRYDERSDLYAIGLCFYELLAGKHPFDNLPLMDQINARTDGKLVPLRELNRAVPARVSDVIAKLTRFDATDRYGSALEALRALDSSSPPSEVATASRARGKATQIPAQQASPVTPSEDLEATVAKAAGEASVSASAGGSAKQGTTQLGGPANVDKPTPAKSSVALSDLFDMPSEEPDALEDEQSEEVEVSIGKTEDENEGNLSRKDTAKVTDLDRIKDIIAKDTAQKEQAAARRAAAERAAIETASAFDRVQQPLGSKTSKPTPRSDLQSTASAGFSSSNNRVIETYKKVPPLFRPLVIALGAACATVLALSLIKMLPFGSGDSASNRDAASTMAIAAQELETQDSGAKESTTEAQSADTPDANEDNGEGFPHIPAGMYAGYIDGIVPGTKSPFTFLSIPQRKLIGVIVGIEGWTPAMVSTANLQPGSATVTVQSNGIVLKIAGAVTSDRIVGTFVNPVTGEKGDWVVRKMS